MLDRLIQQAISQVLTLIFDPGFSESSFGFRPGRSAHGAAKRLRVEGPNKSNSSSAPQPSTFNLQPSTFNLQKQPTEEGSPQGGPLSPLLSNILLDDLDQELERRGLKFVRYADDFVIFVRSERSAHRVFTSVQRYLTRQLKLVVNEQKSSVRPARGCAFTLAE